MFRRRVEALALSEQVTGAREVAVLHGGEPLLEQRLGERALVGTCSAGAEE